MSLELNLNPVFCNISENIGITFYGIMLSLGLFIFYKLSAKRIIKLYPNINAEELSNFFVRVSLAGILGARIIWALNEKDLSLLDFLEFWHGGLSILGGVIGAFGAILIEIYLKKWDFKIIIESIVLYAPLAQMFGRIGCFLVGCCHGAASYNSFFSIIYLNYSCLAPCGIKLYPTQIYSSFFYLLLFLILKKLELNKSKLIIKSYFIGLATERFLVDFIRGDRQIIENKYINLSSHQYISILIIFIISLFIIKDFCKKIIFNRLNQ